jgi:hypothetical protein
MSSTTPARRQYLSIKEQHPDVILFFRMGDFYETFDEDARDALEDFRGMNNFENHDLAVLEDALARGWDDAAGEGEARMVDAIWHGLSRLERE